MQHTMLSIKFGLDLDVQVSILIRHESFYSTTLSISSLWATKGMQHHRNNNDNASVTYDYDTTRQHSS